MTERATLTVQIDNAALRKMIDEAVAEVKLSETSFIVEQYDGYTGAQTRYFSGIAHNTDSKWTTDIRFAVRFNRQRDALAVVQHCGVTYRIVEHSNPATQPGNAV